MERLTNNMSPSRIDNSQLVHDESLKLPASTETDLAIEFSQTIFYLLSTLETIESLRKTIGENAYDKTDQFRKFFKALNSK